MSQPEQAQPHTARFAGDAASDAERDERLNTVLYAEGASKVILTKVRERLDAGLALRNVAVYVERGKDGEHTVIAGYRTGIVDAVKARTNGTVRVDRVVEMLKGHAQKGNVFCVFVLWREDGLADIACVELTTKADR